MSYVSIYVSSLGQEVRGADVLPDGLPLRGDHHATLQQEPVKHV